MPVHGNLQHRPLSVFSIHSDLKGYKQSPGWGGVGGTLIFMTCLKGSVIKENSPEKLSLSDGKSCHLLSL